MSAAIYNRVAMVHCNNCCTDLDYWVNLFADFAGKSGSNLTKPQIYDLLYNTALDGDSATVQAGIIKTKVKTSELRLKDKPVQQQPKKTTLSVSRNSAPAKQEIDVRGQTGDDAYFMIDRFFDSAIMANYHVVTIIHGKGTGALRAAIWAKLRKDKRVKSFRSGSYGEGDFGVTVVEL